MPLSLRNDPLLDSIATENNPRPLRTVMGDGADYWVKTDDQPLTMRFPAKIDRNGQFARLGPYFNLPPSKGLDIPALKKARSQFELKFLNSDDDGDCPPEAIACSAFALSTLMIIYNEQEDQLAQNVKEDVTVTPFWRSYDASRGDYFSAIVSTNPLFQGLPGTGKVVAPKLSRTEFAKSVGTLSPSKAKAAATSAATASSAAGSGSVGLPVIRISNLPDPQGRYAGLLRAHTELANARVVAPDVLDTQGIQILPASYDAKLEDGQFVEVEVYLKFWNIAGGLFNGNNSPGSRVYQLVLKSMKLLPYHLYTKKAMLRAVETVATKKRKARSNEDDESERQGSSKKLATASLSDMEGVEM